ncbi:NADH dehydrogenase [ubiquinone] 1 alpha subcomplex subunit 11-like [Trichoplusia ni]|uniref:NADH dehydrogenase [ubiquinone] 1 alpha subcomplex subunit 11 n=1 Tax=Trichoplusia ni TaxID=7111 RepID=A0A7E5WSN2_TRINI|nr:NADH dehydrogenase [ubiquinone] 1 alpha subcomplex subunit 11-like [Trichoplusia ni]
MSSKSKKDKEKEKKEKDKKKKDKKKAEEENKCDKRGARNYSQYYDAPDGCHVQKKIMVTTRYGIVTGLIAGTYDVLMYSHVVGLAPILTRYARHMVPIALMGATFAAVANAVQHARNVDDPLNYFAGGMACGPILAMYVRSGHGVVAGGLLLGIIAVMKKELVDRDCPFIQKFPPHMNTIRSWRNDWTLVRDPRDDMLHTCMIKRSSDDCS